MLLHPLVLVRHRRVLIALVGLATVVLAGDALRARQNSYDLQTLRGQIDTGFRPGQDDWQFPNYGSTASYWPDGHGLGMVLTAVWYFGAKPDGGGAHLYNRYDNNGGGPTTIWEDDSLALRLVSTVESDLEQEPAVVTPDVVAAKQTPKDVWREVASAMLQTHEPQILTALEVTDDERRIVAVKYLLVYRISDTKLYVADPVYPGHERLPVELTLDGKFQPYLSRDRADLDKVSQYNTMMPFPIGPKIRAQLPKRWQQFRSGKFDADPFLSYALMTVNADGKKYELRDGETYSEPTITIVAENGTLPFGVSVYRDGAWMNQDTDTGVVIGLRPGKNVLGLKISLKALDGKWVWHDFKYLTVNSTACDLRVLPARQYCVVGQHCPVPFAASTLLPLDGLAIDWYLDDALQTLDGPKDMDVTASEEGPHYVKAALRNKETGRIACEAEAMANVQPEPAAAKEPAKAVEPPPPPSRVDVETPPPESHGNPEFWATLHKCDTIWVEVGFAGAEYKGEYSDGGLETYQESSWQTIGGRPYDLSAGTAPPVWDGTTFVWLYSTKNARGEIRGTISPDDGRILSLTASQTATFQVNAPNDPVESHGTITWRIEAKNILVAYWDQEASVHEGVSYGTSPSIDVPNVEANVVRVEYTELEAFSHDPRGGKTGRIDRRKTLAVPNWSGGSSINVVFAITKKGLVPPPFEMWYFGLGIR